MKIAIHHRPGSFSERWIEYCQKNSIDYKIVNAFDNDIIHQVSECDAFMWHHHHRQFRDALTAKRILFALEQAGIKVFPDFNTGWHFDDKVAQKYLLEAIKAPIVPSYIFYDKKEAMSWAKNTTYPKVFKLKGGAGSSNVELISSYKEAEKKINQAFGKGFLQFNKMGNLKEKIRKSKSVDGSFLEVTKGIGRLFIQPHYARLQAPERQYAYFQEFIPNEGFDIRVVVVGDKAIALKRLVRENDFRASGSGNLIFENQNIDQRYIKLAFEVSSKLDSQSLAIDLIHGKNDEISIVEMSYGFPMYNFLDGSSGYWGKQLNWYTEPFNPQYWMIENLINSLE